MLTMKQDFNPRTHAGCDMADYLLHALEMISIHAPTQGATIGDKLVAIGCIISIHAPTQGATLPFRHYFQVSEFQSTHPRRVRQQDFYSAFSYSQISIHAPTQGATTLPTTRARPVTHFNPRTHAGCDFDIKYTFTFAGKRFQSTHPRRVRL